VLLGNVLRCNRIRQEEEVIQGIYSNKIDKSSRSRTEYKRLLSKRRKENR
jgi:hypothetical protein